MKIANKIKNNKLKEIYIKNIKQDEYKYENECDFIKEEVNVEKTDNSNNIKDSNNLNNSDDNKIINSNLLLTKRQSNDYNELNVKNNKYQQIEKNYLGKIKKFFIFYIMKKSDLDPDIQWPDNIVFGSRKYYLMKKNIFN